MKAAAGVKPALSHLGIACSLGSEQRSVLAQLLAGSTRGMARTEQFSPGRSLVVGQVRLPLPEIEHAALHLRSRNNRLLLAALAPLRVPVAAAVERYGRERIAVVLGTSTSGISEAEAAFLERQRTGALPSWFDYRQMELGNPSEFLATELGISGPALTISTACSSSAMALLAARRMLAGGLCDAAVVGGADSLSRFTVAGFGALEALSPELCNPMSRNRDGINIGEGAALFLMTPEGGPVRLCGGGASSDAHHVSAPDPSGLGAAEAMQSALADADLQADALDYVNLHGTATEQNDAMESRAMAAVLGSEVSASSTKPLTGHALGAAGALEAAFCWLVLSAENEARRLPPHVFDGETDPALPPLRLVAPGQTSARLRRVMSNSFGFFGSNAVLIFEATA
jgi:3-oxoacyl-[acyl-carrier-protein] synthase-1